LNRTKKRKAEPREMAMRMGDLGTWEEMESLGADDRTDKSVREMRKVLVKKKRGKG
jgi:hypothetical protein